MKTLDYLHKPCCSGQLLDVGPDKLWPEHHLQLSGKDNQKDKERKSVMICFVRVTTPRL